MRFKKVVRWAGAALAFYLLSTLAFFVFFTAQDAPYKAKFDTLRTNGYVTTGTITSFVPHGGVC